MSEFKAVIKDLQDKIDVTFQEEGQLTSQMTDLLARRDKLKAAMESIEGLEDGGAPARGRGVGKRPAPAVNKGAAKKAKAPADPARTCAGCGATRWKAFAKCEVCGKPKCGKCGVRGRSKSCSDCGGSLKEKAPKPAGKKPGAAWRAPLLKKPTAAPAPAAAALPQGKKKCEGCAHPAGEFGKCETCGADYCTARCLKDSADCPACRSLTRGDD